MEHSPPRQTLLDDMTPQIDEPNRQFVAFSGGVDSTALALLMPEATPIFTDTGWEFQHVYDHIEKFERTTGREVIKIRAEDYKSSSDACRSNRQARLAAAPSRAFRSIPDYIEHYKYLPNYKQRWCTEKFKITPMNTFLEQHLPCTLNIALRADEDARTGNQTLSKSLTIAYPLQEWGMTRKDVIKVCIDHNLIQRYPPYAARGGCKGCFYKRKSELVAMQALIPEVMDELRSLEEAVQGERGKFFHMFPSAGMSIAEIQAQPPLFDLSNVYAQAADTSDYGENCGLFCNR